jgi:hypothetical protein
MSRGWHRLLPVKGLFSILLVEHEGKKLIVADG